MDDADRLSDPAREPRQRLRARKPLSRFAARSRSECRRRWVVPEAKSGRTLMLPAQHMPTLIADHRGGAGGTGSGAGADVLAGPEADNGDRRHGGNR
jgi:hypothetical protein